MVGGCCYSRIFSEGFICTPDSATRFNTVSDVGRRLAEIWRVLKPKALYQGTMLPTRNINYGRGPHGRLRHLCPRPGRGTRAPAFLLRCGDPRCAIRRLRAAFSQAATAAQARLLALAHHRRTPAAVEARAERNVAISATQSGHMLRRIKGHAPRDLVSQHEPGNGIFYPSLLPPSAPRFPSLQNARVAPRVGLSSL